MQESRFGKLTLYGPHPLERDSQGHLKNPMADIFPSFESMIVGSGLHVTLANEFLSELEKKRGSPLSEREQEKVYEDLVALVLRGNHVVIRSMPENMEQCFRAAELLEEIVPSEVIRFTGSRDPKVREAFKLRGECWKMTPEYFTYEEIIRQIRLSLVSVNTENRYYYKMESGGRLVTYQQFSAIRESLADFAVFKRRIFEVLDLYRRRNKQFVRELDFFMVDPEKFDISLLEKLAEYLENCKHWGEKEQKKAEELFEAVLANFRKSVAPDFLEDDPKNPVWRTYMYSELNDIPPTEESILGVSDEFNMNIRWVPGCRITNGRKVLDPHVEEPVAKLLDEFFRFYGELDYINLGRVMRSQNTKRAAGSYREVYIVVLKQKNTQVEQIRFLRKVRRDTLYYLNLGHPLEKAQRLAEGYLQYTLDRREILSLLGVNTPPLNRMSRTEELPGIGSIHVYFFDRPYIHGLATDKISSYYYEHEGFVRAQAALMGDEAGLNLIIGRSDPDTGDVFFGDGDEMLLFGEDKFVPTGLVLSDFTGTFADVVSPLEKFLPFYVDYIVDMLSKVRIEGFDLEDKHEVAEIFIEAMKKRIIRTRELLEVQGSVAEKIQKLVAERQSEYNPIRIKWEMNLERLKNLDLDAFINRLRAAVETKIGYC